MRYLPQIKNVVSLFDADGLNRYFVFGSAARQSAFHDIDIGVQGNSRTHLPLSALREKFYDAPIPYRVDVVDFDEASTDFREYVFMQEPIIWIH